MKTAALATNRHGVIAFSGAYHGLGYGALNATHREFFRSPFRMQLREFGSFVPYPETPADLAAVDLRVRRLFKRGWVGAVLVEPVQARGGINVPPPGFLPLLRQLCDEHGALLILDEIYTGLGRTGRWFACERSGTVPDLICLGKALTGGFPLSACVGRRRVMDAARPPSKGEAIHTSTFLGHPVGCAMALANIGEIARLKLPERSATLGEHLLGALEAIPEAGSGSRCVVRGQGLMAGLELRRSDGSPDGDAAMRAIKAMLKEGFILLPEGEHGSVISFTPPLTITRVQLDAAVGALRRVLAGA